MSVRSPFLPCLLGLALALTPTRAPAQSTEEPAAAPSPVEEAAALADRIEEEQRELDELRKPLKKPTEEERALRLQRLREEEIRIGAMIHDLGEQVRSLSDAPGIEPVRERLLRWLRHLPRDVSRQIERRQEVLDEARRHRDEAAANRLLEAEERVTTASRAVDELLQYYAQNLELLDYFGVDSRAARSEVVERLKERAGRTATRIQVTHEARAQLAKVIAAAPGDSDAKLRALQLDERIDASVDSLRLLSEQLRALEVDTSDYQSLLVKVTGDISDVGLSASAVSSLARDWAGSTLAWLKSNGPRLLGRSVVVLLVLILTAVLARLARRVVERAFQLRPEGTSHLLQRTVSRLTGQLVLLLGLLVALSQAGVSVGPMIAGLGIAGFVVAFALQDTLSNFASGAFILFYQPFDEGDVVEAGGVSGKVLNMTVVSTTILTFDNQTLIVPNKMIWGDVIRNVTAQSLRRVDLVFGIAYDDDIEKAEAVLRELLEQDERVLDDPPPLVRLHELGDSSVNFIVRPWVSRDDYWDVYWDLTRMVKLRFDEAGLSIPFPQRDVHLHQVQPAAPRAAGTRDARPQGAADERDLDPALDEDEASG